MIMLSMYIIIHACTLLYMHVHYYLPYISPNRYRDGETRMRNGLFVSFVVIIGWWNPGGIWYFPSEFVTKFGYIRFCHLLYSINSSSGWRNGKVNMVKLQR